MRKYITLLALLATITAPLAHAKDVNAYLLDINGNRVDPATGGSTTQSVAVVTQPTVSQVPFMVAVASGQVSGYSSVNKFGHNPAGAAGQDMWEGGGLYAFFPTSAVSCSITSTSGNDTAAGTGARTVMIFGLDSNWDEISETVTLGGVSVVPLTNTYVRLYRAFVVTAGSGGNNAGIVTVTGGGNVGAYIAVGEGQTQQAIYTIPRGKTGYFIKGYVGIADDDKGGESMEFHWLMRANNGTTGAWQIKGQIALGTLSSSWWQYEYGVPAGPIHAKTDIRITVPDSSLAMGCVGGFDLLLVDD